MKNQLLLLFVLLTIPSFAQYRTGLIPRESPLKKFSNTIGYTEVSISYSSPSVRDRRIWGDLVPYEEIWRAGANEATKLSFSKDIQINGQNVPAGEYALFMIPYEDGEWTIILNKEADQWGAFQYNKENDAIRTKIKPFFNVNYHEDLKYDIVDVGYDTGLIRMVWENMELDIEFSRNLLPDLIQKIEATVESLPDTEDWVVYLQGAEFLIDRGKDLDLAYEWLHLSESLFENADKNVREKSNYFLGHLFWTYAIYYKSIGNQRQAMNYWIKMRSIDEGTGYYSKGIGPENAESLKKELESY